MTDRPTDPLNAILDFAVYAPIGAVLHGPEAIEELAAKGRQDVKNARAIGKITVDRGRRELDRLAAEAQERLSEFLAAAAQATAKSTEEQAPSASSSSESEAAASDDTVTGMEEPPDLPSRPEPIVAPPAAPSSVPPSGGRSEVPSAASLPIPDYDNLAASQVVPRLSDLTSDELLEVEAYERAHRGRMTILSRIAQLRAD